MIPPIISVDDHVIEPRDLWTARAPATFRDRVPRVERSRARTGAWEMSGWQFVEDPDDPGANDADVWVYEDTRLLLQRGFAAVGVERGELDNRPLTYEDMRPGCFDQAHRLADMDRNNTEVSLCFPSVSRFAGQFFMNRQDPQLALECLRIYNDWMIDEWCGGEGAGRLVPVTLVPLWDAELAAAEVRRCAAKGSYAITFSECPPHLGLPSLYSGHWRPLMEALDETGTVVNMHIGSSSRMPMTSEDAPHMTTSILFFQNGMHAAIDWVLSGSLATYPNIRIALSEAQFGWMPFVMERMDNVWERNAAIDKMQDAVPEPPSTYIRRQVYGCVFDDLSALRAKDTVGMSQLMFETDYPHADSTWDYSTDVARRLVEGAGLDEEETWRFVRGNAIDCYRLDERFGVEARRPAAATGTA